jgi:3',5'-nucleoside bisphosphate phosphatase
VDLRIDLHTHSHHSDGTLTPVQLVALAAERQVRLLALTDHDTTAGCAAAAQACHAYGIQFLRSTELSALWRGREIHIVGLRLASDTLKLAAHLRAVREQRVARVQAIGERLTRCGLDGDALTQQVLALPGTPTRLHLARALVACGLVGDADEAFKRYLGRGQRAAVPAQWASAEACIDVIVGAGGLAVLAHPHRYQLSAGAMRELCAAFRDSGGVGIEVSLAGMGPGDAGQAAALARRYGLAGSLGSDFHVPGLPWRPLGRWLKLADGVTPITELLGFTPAGAPQAAEP